jgi:hypothetical protein
MERNNNESGTVTPIERLRQRLNDKLDVLKYGLEKLEHGQAADVEWTRLVYEQHIERCHQWLKAIERVN